MTGLDLVRAAEKNLSCTYLEIARGISGTSIHRSAGFVAALNNFPHPICNFAVCEDRGALESRELLDIARSRPAFNIYMPRSVGDGAKIHLLAATDYDHVYTLAVMAGAGAGPREPACLRSAQSYAERIRVAKFMAEQFFGSQKSAVRAQIVEATASASGLDLLELEPVNVRNAPSGSVMLNSDESVLGLYNLCVASVSRRRGIGSSIVAAVLEFAENAKKSVVLQCDPRLEQWYGGLGFQTVGSVDVLGVGKAS